MDFKQVYLKLTRFFTLVTAFLCLVVTVAHGYKVFLISLPDDYGKPKVTKTFFAGAAAPAFGIIYNLKPPLKAFLVFPNGTTQKLALIKTQFFDQAFNVNRIGFKTPVYPTKKGDYYLCLKSDYVLLSNGTLAQFLVKTPFHVVTENGWENSCGFELEIKPYTRPYGFIAHGVFWGQVWFRGKPLDNGTVEVERFSPNFLTKEDLPKDSYGQINYPYLKSVTRLSKNGFFVVSFEKPGWWVITVKVPAGEKTYANQVYPLLIEHSFWVYVFPAQKKFPKYEYFYPFP